ncbi:MAG TPA: LysO family transporter [Ferruginibacter sp.]|nr:LysO family transporter [Ferruginibacter sp.]
MGCGTGHLLKELGRRRPDGRYIGFDPNAPFATEGRVEFRGELFVPDRHLAELQPQMLISRHVLEHLMNPLGFLQSIALAASWTDSELRLFTEVPCIDRVFETGRFVDFYYEHNSHFTTRSFMRMLQRSGGVEIVPAAIVHGFLLSLLVPILIAFFAWMARRKRPVSTANKFAWALIISGLSALVMVLAVMSVPSIYTHKASPIWLFLTYGVFTVSEVCLSPIGLSFVSKLSPPRLTALMMGGWFLSTSLGGKVAGVMASFWDQMPDKRIFFGIITVAAILGGLLIFSKVKSLDQIVKDKTGSA